MATGRHGRLGWFGWPALVGVLAISAVLYFAYRSVDTEAPGTAYDTETVDRGAVVQRVTASGRVEPVVTVEVGSQLSGQIAAIYADYNDQVTKDQLIAQLDPQTFASRVASAEADLAVAEASLAIQIANVAKAEAVLQQSRREADRQSRLAERGTAAQTALENAQTDVAVATADLSIAKAQVDNAKAVVLQRAATLEQARIDLERTEIRSPIDGVIVSRDVDVGQTVAASLQAPILFTIAQDLSIIQVAADVNEADVGRIETGDPVTFSVDTFPDRVFRGVVKQVRLAATEIASVVTYTVIISATNRDQRLFPGMTATAEITTGSVEDVMRVPVAAARFIPPGEQRTSASDRRAGLRTTVLAMAAALDLTADQKEELEAGLEAMAERARQRRRSGGNRGGPSGAPPAGFDPARLRQLRLAAIDRLFADLLTDTQKPTYEALKGRLPEARATNVWVAVSSLRLEARPVLLGLDDGQYVEVIAGELEPGEAVATRVRRSAS